MNTSITPWNSPNGIIIPPETESISQLTSFVKALSPHEINKIEKACNNKLFDMATEYTWRRTINVIREKIISFGREFVLEMLGRTGEQNDENDFLSEVDIINLAADLGFINKTARVLFLNYSELIQHYSSRDADSEMDPFTAKSCIFNCIKYVLSMDEDNYDFSFTTFRDRLKLSKINNDDNLIDDLINTPYFYKRTTVRTLLNLAKSTSGAELENVFSNMITIIPSIWPYLLSDDRYPIGFAYTEAINKNNKDFVKALKSVLLKVKGFDYVPENLRSTTFIECAKNLLKTHNGFNNFHNEPSVAHLLSSLGTSIPGPAVGICITASLAVKLGNYYGHSFGAQEHVNDILKNISTDRWQYYFNQVLPGDTTILYKLAYQDNPISRWIAFLNDISISNISFTTKDIEELITNSKKGKAKLVKSIAQKLYNKLI